MILDSVVAALLFVTILYCWRLSKKISALNSSRKELRSLINEFNLAIVRAESGISNLKQLSSEADQQLQKHIEKARFLTNDLAFLTHKGEAIAEKMDGNIAQTRINSAREVRFTGNPRLSTTPTHAPTITKRKAPPEDVITTKNPNPVKELGWKNVEKPIIRNDKPDNKNDEPQDMTNTKRRALEEVLEQIAARKKKKLSSTNENNNSSTIIGTESPPASS